MMCKPLGSDFLLKARKSLLGIRRSCLHWSRFDTARLYSQGKQSQSDISRVYTLLLVLLLVPLWA
jgi:hypothetical protein